MTPVTSIEVFWASCRAVTENLPALAPEAWAFGATPEQADELLDLVLAGTKTATASSLWDYEAESEPLPTVGEYSIVLDGRGAARAVIQTTDVDVVPFDEVTAAHAHAEGEGDLSLTFWRESHEQFWRAHSTDSRGFAVTMPVVCERFRLVYRL
jgi:histidinol-phosphate aminotransferase